MFCIYLITNLKNNKVYIGQTSKSSRERWNQHLNYAKSNNTKLHQLIHKAINKYGPKSFIVSTIEFCETEEEALESEIFWISFYKSNVSRYGNYFGYNLTDGGEGSVGYHHTEDAKNKLSKMREGKVLPEEVKIKMSEIHTGKHQGSDNNRAKLTEDDVIMIKKLLLIGESPINISKKFNVKERAIRNIRAGRTWSHLLDEYK